ncbi:hypothetical protein [Erythrobacter tepidarius]|uniref:hypothetical protein n=1 Tax=Erythrobacter tepidarius TaxID=60454 RepID=UPI001302A561|nr:hypothetical protein [Erythrobacter tepidarius]
MLVFFPRTLYLTIRHPQRMMDYADTELGDVQSGQYSDTLSPPLFLMMCLGLSHLIELALPVSDLGKLPGFLQDTQNLLLFRVFMFSLLPLVLSLRLLNKLGIALDRETLRPIFYSQCFITAPITLVVGTVGVLWQIGNATAAQTALIILAGGSLWYLWQEMLWFRAKLGIGYVAAAANAVGATLAAIILIIVTLLLIGFALAKENQT